MHPHSSLAIVFFLAIICAPVFCIATVSCPAGSAQLCYKPAIVDFFPKAFHCFDTGEVVRSCEGCSQCASPEKLLDAEISTVWKPIPDEEAFKSDSFFAIVDMGTIVKVEIMRWATFGDGIHDRSNVAVYTSDEAQGPFLERSSHLSPVGGGRQWAEASLSHVPAARFWKIVPKDGVFYPVMREISFVFEDAPCEGQSADNTSGFARCGACEPGTYSADGTQCTTCMNSIPENAVFHTFNVNATPCPFICSYRRFGETCEDACGVQHVWDGQECVLTGAEVLPGVTFPNSEGACPAGAATAYSYPEEYMINGAHVATDREVELDGADDYVDLGPLNLGNIITVEANITVEEGAAWTTIAHFSDDTNENHATIGLFGSSGRLYLETRGGVFVIDPEPLPLQQWVFITADIRGSTGRLFVNGKKVAQRSDIFLFTKQMVDMTHSYLGRGRTPGINHLTGRISWFRVFPKALPLEKIGVAHDDPSALLVGFPMAFCAPCETNFFKEATDNSFCAACGGCGDGFFVSGCQGPVAGNCTTCSTCEAGKFRDGCSGTSPGQCQTCAEGKFQASETAAPCTKCAACGFGKFRSRCGGSSSGSCTPVSESTWNVVPDPPGLGECPSGTYIRTGIPNQILRKGARELQVPVPGIALSGRGDYVDLGELTFDSNLGLSIEVRFRFDPTLQTSGQSIFHMESAWISVSLKAWDTGFEVLPFSLPGGRSYLGSNPSVSSGPDLLPPTCPPGSTLVVCVSSDTWVHFVIVVLSDMVRIYFDGSLVQEQTLHKSESAEGSTQRVPEWVFFNSFIGTAEPSPGSSLRGDISDFRIYGRVMTTSEIQAHNQGVFTSDSNLMVQLPLSYCEVDCQSCSAGFHSSPCRGSEGNSSCVACTAGKFKANEGPELCSGCGQCQLGQYSVGCGGTSPGECVECEDCPALFFRDGCGGSTAGNCTQFVSAPIIAKDGGWCPAGSTNISGFPEEILSAGESRSGSFTVTASEGVEMVEIAYGAHLDLGTLVLGGDLSIEIRVKPSSPYVEGPLVELSDASCPLGQGSEECGMRDIYLRVREGGSLEFGSFGGVITASEALTWNEWVHVVAMIDGTNATLYVDGVLVSSGQVYPQPFMARGPNVIGISNREVAGCLYGSGGGIVCQPASFSGTLAEFRVYGRALDSAEVAAHASSIFSSSSDVKLLAQLPLQHCRQCKRGTFKQEAGVHACIPCMACEAGFFRDGCRDSSPGACTPFTFPRVNTVPCSSGTLPQTGIPLHLLVNGPSVSNDGVELDGIDDFLELGEMTLPAELTVEMDIKRGIAGNVGQDSTFVEFSNRASDGLLRVGIEGNTGHLFLQTSPGSSFKAPSALPLNTWARIAVALGLDGEKLYIDGVEVASSATVSSREPILRQVYIGKGDGGSNYFKGTINNMRVYGRTRSAGELASEAGGGWKHNMNSSLLFQLPMDFCKPCESGTFLAPDGSCHPCEKCSKGAGEIRTGCGGAEEGSCTVLSTDEKEDKIYNSNPVLWFKAESGDMLFRSEGGQNFVERWHDRSGNHHDLVQADPSSQPVFERNAWGNGEHAVRFDPESNTEGPKFLEISNYKGLGSGEEIAIIAKIEPTSPHGTILSQGFNLGGNVHGWALHRGTNNRESTDPNTLSWGSDDGEGNGGWGTWAASPCGSSPSNLVHVVSLRKLGRAVRLFVNNRLVFFKEIDSPDIGYLNSTGSDAPALWLGKGADPTGYIINHFAGRIRELVVWKRQVRSNELKNLGTIVQGRCFNGLQDGDEEDVDCGGPCAPCQQVPADVQLDEELAPVLVRLVDSSPTSAAAAIDSSTATWSLGEEGSYLTVGQVDDRKVMAIAITYRHASIDEMPEEEFDPFNSFGKNLDYSRPLLFVEVWAAPTLDDPWEFINNSSMFEGTPQFGLTADTHYVRLGNPECKTARNLFWKLVFRGRGEAFHFVDDFRWFRRDESLPLPTIAWNLEILKVSFLPAYPTLQFHGVSPQVVSFSPKSFACRQNASDPTDYIVVASCNECEGVCEDASRVVDGSVVPWSASVPLPEVAIEIDLGLASSVGAIGLIFEGGAFSTSGQVFVSDNGQEWDSLQQFRLQDGSASSSESTTGFVLDQAISVRYWRFQFDIVAGRPLPVWRRLLFYQPHELRAVEVVDYFPYSFACFHPQDRTQFWMVQSCNDPLWDGSELLDGCPSGCQAPGTVLLPASDTESFSYPEVGWNPLVFAAGGKGKYFELTFRFPKGKTGGIAGLVVETNGGSRGGRLTVLSADSLDEPKLLGSFILPRTQAVHLLPLPAGKVVDVQFLRFEFIFSKTPRPSIRSIKFLRLHELSPEASVLAHSPPNFFCLDAEGTERVVSCCGSCSGRCTDPSNVLDKGVVSWKPALSIHVSLTLSLPSPAKVFGIAWTLTANLGSDPAHVEAFAAQSLEGNWVRVGGYDFLRGYEKGWWDPVTQEFQAVASVQQGMELEEATTAMHWRFEVSTTGWETQIGEIEFRIFPGTNMQVTSCPCLMVSELGRLFQRHGCNYRNTTCGVPDPQLFFGKMGQIRLDLSHLSIRSIDPRAFRGLDQIEVLDLSYNQLSIFEPNSFQPLNRLEVLLMIGNAITRMSDANGETLESLRIIQLNRNLLTRVHAESFFGMESLRRILLKDNALTCVPVLPDVIEAVEWTVRKLDPCLPDQCLVSAMSSFAAPAQIRSTSYAVSNVMNNMRADVARDLDQFHLSRSLYIDGNEGMRCWCFPAGKVCFELPANLRVAAIRACEHGTAVSTCPDGYDRRGKGYGTCVDVNECRLEQDNCDPQNGVCENVPGGFRCDCRRGYNSSDFGLTCEEVDECAEQVHNCHPQAQCVNTDSSFTCTCKPDWESDDEGVTCVPLDLTCEENDGAICHMLGQCTWKEGPVEIPVGNDIVDPEVLVPRGSSKDFQCSCFPEQLGHGYGPNGCATKGYAVRIVYRGRGTVELSASEEMNLVGLLGDVECTLGSLHGCDHILYASHAGDLGVMVLFAGSAQGLQAAHNASQTFNAAAVSRRAWVYPPEVDPAVGARVYSWNSGSTGSPIQVLPSGMDVESVFFQPNCGATGCWVIDIVYTTGSGYLELETFNSFYVPYAVGSDQLSFDYTYAVNGIMDTFEPAKFSCRVSDYTGADGEVESLPVRATGCCFGTAFDANNTQLGGDGSGQGMLGRYRVTDAFASYAEAVYPQLCPGGFENHAINSSTPRPQDKFPSVSAANSFLAPGQRFVGLPDSPGITERRAIDSFIGQYRTTIALDEVELRTKAGLLTGTVGVEHTVDFFVGFASFKAATESWILDSFATQTKIHVEKTGFFTVSTHGINQFTFLEYVNMRLVAVYMEDGDFSGDAEAGVRFLRTNSSNAAHYVQVTFTVGSKYSVPSNSALIPLDSVRAGRGDFYTQVEAAGGLHHKCLEYTSSPDHAFGSWDTIARFEQQLDQTCGPAALMCTSPASLEDSFVAFNIPLGFDFFGQPSDSLDNNIFVHLVISAHDELARAESTDPNSGEAPWQMKTTLQASIPVVRGGINVFCDGITAKTDLKDVATATIIVGSAANLPELSRLRIIDDVASSQLSVQPEVLIDSDSIEAGLLTVVLQGNESFFRPERAVSLELEDVVTIHLMETDGESVDGSGSEGKQEAVKALLSEPADDNTDAIAGLDTDGYALNGAFFFTVDRSAQRAHLEPSPRLLAICPFNPPRPQVTGSVVMETCVTRRDVRYRDYPWRVGAVSTAMEITASAYDTPLMTSSVESGFFASILGNSLYAKQLAVDFASTIDEKYSLNGRSRRAFWINPGYEWSPTQTGGASLFQISQKLFLFALVTLDERIASSPGKSIFDAAPFQGQPEDVAPPGASETGVNLPRVVGLGGRRRTLLSVDPTPGSGSALSAAQVTFATSQREMVASAFGVPVDLVASFRVQLELSSSEACLGAAQLQTVLRDRLLAHVTSTASELESVQVTSQRVVGLPDCDKRRLLGENVLTAVVGMIVVFSAGTQPKFDMAAFEERPGIRGISPVFVSNVVSVTEPRFVKSWTGTDPETESSGRGLSTALLAGIAVAGAGALCAVAVIVIWMRRGKCQEQASVVQQNFGYLRDEAKVGHSDLNFVEFPALTSEVGRHTSKSGVPEGWEPDGPGTAGSTAEISVSVQPSVSSYPRPHVENFSASEDTRPFE